MADTATTDTGKTDETVETPDTGSDAAKTFTQAEIDKIVEARIKRERSKFGDYDDLKAKASKFDEAEAERLSDLEKAQKAAADAIAERDAVKAAAEDTQLRSAIREAARDANLDPDSALDALLGSAKDTLDATDMAGTMEKLLAARPNLAVAERKQTPSADQGARGTGTQVNQVTAAELTKMTPQEIVTARGEGRLASLLGAS